MNFPLRSASPSRIMLGWCLITTLGDDPETADLAEMVAREVEALERAMDNAWSFERSAVVASMRVATADSRLTRSLRRLARGVSELEGRGRAGPLQTWLFPDGLHTVTRRVSDSKLQAFLEVRQRLADATTPMSESARARFSPMLDEALGVFRMALDRRETAKEEALRARQIEHMAREDLACAFERVEGALRMRFPRDHGRQRSYWPKAAFQLRSGAPMLGESRATASDVPASSAPQISPAA
jgi:hypothetical protein